MKSTMTFECQQWSVSNNIVYTSIILGFNVVQCTCSDFYVWYYTNNKLVITNVINKVYPNAQTILWHYW